MLMSFPVLLIAVASAGARVSVSDIACDCDELASAVASDLPSGQPILCRVHELQEGNAVDL